MYIQFQLNLMRGIFTSENKDLYKYMLLIHKIANKGKLDKVDSFCRYKIQLITHLQYLTLTITKILQIGKMDILHVNHLDNGDTIYYSIVEKQSERGFSMNKRLLLMVENHFICYLSQPNIQFTNTKDYISKNAKMTVDLKQINKITDKREDKKLIIHFWLYEKHKRAEKVWTLRFNNQELLLQWLEKFEDYTNRSRNNTLERVNTVASKPENNQNGYESAGRLIRRLSKKDIQAENIQFGSSNNRMPITTEQKFNNPQQFTPNSPSNPKQNESFFENVNFVSPSPFKDQNSQYPQQHQIPNNILNTEGSKTKDRSIYFSNAVDFQNANSRRYSFKNYYRPYIDLIIKNPNNIAKNNQLHEVGNKLNKFLEYSKQSVTILIQQKLQKLKQLERYKDIKFRVSQSSPNWIRYNQIEDLDIQLGLIQLKNVKNENYICDGALTKMEMNNFKNLEYLYDVIRKDVSLIDTFYIPMACAIIYKGYTCFVTSKIVPQQDQQFNIDNGEIKQTAKMFDKLANLSKIGFQVFENERNIKFIPKNAKKDKFVIQYARTYLPELQNCLIIRKESFNMIYPQYQNENYIYLVSKKENQHQNNKISKHLNQRIIELSDLMNKLEVYPLSPSQMSEILHCFGINVKHISQLYNKITQYYIQSVIKTDAALRVIKIIFNKKLQEKLGANRRNIFEETGRQLINVLVGYGENTDQLWKVVSLHSQMYFNLSVQQGQINKGYLLLGFYEHLSLQIISNYSGIDKIFKVNNFVEAIKFHPKVKPPNLIPSFLKMVEDEYDIAMNEILFNKILVAFDLQDQQIPTFLHNYRYTLNKLLYLLSFYIKPNDSKYHHLRLYQATIPQEYEKIKKLSFFNMQRQVIQIKWEIKNGSKPEYILMLMNKVKDTVQNYYGKNHPFISEIYELQSLYFLQIFQEEQAININKQSLSNMIQCCGNNNRHLKISNNYYLLGECLKKCYRFDEAIVNFKKAKNILEINSYQNFPEYAHILYKLGIMYLLQNKDNESYQLFMHSAAIYEHSDIYSHWDSLVELYEAIHRCQVKVTGNNRVAVILSDLRLAEHCITQLEKILSVELQFEICNDIQFIRLLKIVVEQYINCIKRDDKVAFRAYIQEICDYFNQMPRIQVEPSQSQSIIFFKNLITEGKFCEIIQGYIIQTYEILTRLKNQKRIGRLLPHKRNQLIESYDQFMKNMVGMLGESFILNIL